MVRLTLEQVVGRVFTDDAYHLLRCLPDAGADLIPADPMYGVTLDPKPGSGAWYGFGPDPCRGDPNRWAALHLPILRECQRVLRVGGVLAWAMGSKHRDYFPKWFGPHRRWSLGYHCFGSRRNGNYPYSHIWVVQRKTEYGMEPVGMPNADNFIEMRTPRTLLKVHPCPKSVEEMTFLGRNLSHPGDLALDCFAGIGTSLVAAKLLGRRSFGCDIWGPYVEIARQRLKETKPLLRSAPAMGG
jgi:hypothetical protein